MRLAAWNIRTLLDRGDRHERRTAIIARELARYDIDVAALSETRISGSTQFEEVGAGYTFFCIGHQEGETRHGGVGFAIRSSLLKTVQQMPCGISPRLMKMQVNLDGGHTATLLSCYAPTLAAPQDEKEEFYEQLSVAIDTVAFKDKLFVLGDFNARVGQDYQLWHKVIGRHGIGNENANGSLLLDLCVKQSLVITNTVFQQANKFKASWMHPRSKHWHLIDYVLVRQRDLRDIRLTRVMRPTTAWSDHRMVRCTVFLAAKPVKRKHRAAPRKKLDVSKLKSDETRLALQKELANALSSSDTDEWPQFKSTVFNTAANVIGYRTTHHKDWFDDQDQEAKRLLDEMHGKHLTWMNDKHNSAKKSAYVQARGAAQKRLRQMKEAWWSATAELMQFAADRHDMKTFYDGLKAVYGPRNTGSIPVHSKDGKTLITDRAGILSRWAEHFHSVLNQTTTFDPSVLSEIPVWDTNQDLMQPPVSSEVQRAIKQMASGKAPGPDGLPPELFKSGGQDIVEKLVTLYQSIWSNGTVPQEFKDALIVHIFKQKGDRSVCDDHRGISLLSIPGKILARVILNRLTKHVTDNSILPESQCGFRSGRGTMDMIFAARQLQEKCREQQRELYAVFVDLTKAFDSVDRSALWEVLLKIGCPPEFINIIRSFHEGMRAAVVENGEMSPDFDVTNGTKQGCVLAPLLFIIFFAMMLRVAFQDCEAGVPIHYRTDGDVFDLRRLQAKTKIQLAVLRDLLFADDCALVAHTPSEAQLLFDRFYNAAKRFGLTVSLKKTEAMCQSYPPSQTASVKISAGDGTVLKSVDKFCYLGSFLSNTISMDSDIASRLAKAGCAFGKLQRRLWGVHDVSRETKIAVYQAVVLTTLLYGCETWTLYRRSIRRLDQFHLRCLRKIAGIKWQDRVTNTEVLQICNITGIEPFLLKAQLRWTGHVMRMPDSRIPKQVFCGELAAGRRPQCGPVRRYKDAVKVNMKRCGLNPSTLSRDAQDRSAWRTLCHEAVDEFEKSRVEALEHKRAVRKFGAQPSSNLGVWPCNSCSRICSSRIGLYTHQRTHR